MVEPREDDEAPDEPAPEVGDAEPQPGDATELPDDVRNGEIDDDRDTEPDEGGEG